MQYLLNKQEYDQMVKNQELIDDVVEVLRRNYDESTHTYTFTQDQYRELHCLLLGFKGSAFKVKSEMKSEPTIIFP